jgi:lipoprotein NlpD
MAVIATGFLGGCSHPGPAPVVSREYRKPVIKPRSGYYRVRRGDTMYSIAWRFGYDHRRMAAWNGIRPPYTIYPGQLIRIKPPTRINVAKTPRYTKSPPSRSTRTTTQKKSASTKKVTSTKNTKRKSVSSVKLRWQWPTKGKVIQSFSSKDPNRKGIKLAGYAGEAVYASEAGKVVYSGSGLIGYGMLIIVKHNNDYLSAYGHNRKLLVKEGDQVKRGMRIAEMGKNGSGQAMLHFEIRRNGNPINPVALLPRRR